MEEVKIGDQIWMVKNLDVATFRNGDPIPEAKTEEEWNLARVNEQPAWCSFNNDQANGEKYGKLYNWYAVNDPRGLAPMGFHVPTNEDWEELVAFLGGKEKVGKKLKATYDWSEKEKGTDEVGFSALPGGYRIRVGDFANIGMRASWWTSSESDRKYAWMRYEQGGWVWAADPKATGLSVRCIKD
jgi:uncharacterized protein (TIGR02145 family)